MYDSLTSRARQSARGSFLLLLALGSAAQAATSPVEPAPVTVDITKFAYTPKDLNITPGTTVVWTNRDEVPHTVTAKDKSFASKAMDTDDRFEYTFTKEGDFDYYCTVHPFMTGAVHVHKP